MFAINKTLCLSILISIAFSARAQVSPLDWLNDNVIGDRQAPENTADNEANNPKTKPSDFSHLPAVTFSPEVTSDKKAAPNGTESVANTTDKQATPFFFSFPTENNRSSNNLSNTDIEWGKEDDDYAYKTVSLTIDSRTLEQDSKKLNDLLARLNQEGWELEVTRTSKQEYPAVLTNQNGADYANSRVDYRFRKKKKR